MPNYLEFCLLDDCSEVLDLSYSLESPAKRKGRQQRTGKQQRNRWSAEEETVYRKFLKRNMDMFQNEESRRENKVFRLICQEIRTRTIHQVKSHHQKMVKKHKHIQAIIDFLQSKQETTQPSSPPQSLSHEHYQSSTKDIELSEPSYSPGPSDLLMFQQIEGFSRLASPAEQTLSHSFLYGEYLGDNNWFLDL